MYIKAFDENLRGTGGFQFEVGKTYAIEGELEMRWNGFHFCDNLSDTLKYYFPYSRYCIVEPLGVVIKELNKYATDKIKIVRELSFDELIDLDTTGSWACHYAKFVENADIERLQEHLLKVDLNGRWLYEFSKCIKEANRELIAERLKNINSNWTLD